MQKGCEFKDRLESETKTYLQNKTKFAIQLETWYPQNLSMGWELPSPWAMIWEVQKYRLCHQVKWENKAPPVAKEQIAKDISWRVGCDVLWVFLLT